MYILKLNTEHFESKDLCIIVSLRPELSFAVNENVKKINRHYNEHIKRQRGKCIGFQFLSTIHKFTFF